MRTDVTLAILHHFAVFGLLALLVAERGLLLQAPGRDAVLRLVRLDLFYGITAGLVLAIGIARVVWGMKGAQFYLGNAFFWLKLASFLVAAALSAVPTVRYFRWRAVLRADANALPAPAALGATARLIDVQLALLLAMAAFAALMARGYGQL